MSFSQKVNFSVAGVAYRKEIKILFCYLVTFNFIYLAGCGIDSVCCVCVCACLLCVTKLVFCFGSSPAHTHCAFFVNSNKAERCHCFLPPGSLLCDVVAAIKVPLFPAPVSFSNQSFLNASFHPPFIFSRPRNAVESPFQPWEGVAR